MEKAKIPKWKKSKYNFLNKNTTEIFIYRIFRFVNIFKTSESWFIRNVNVM